MFTFYCGCIGEEWAGEDYMKELVSVYLEEVNCTPQKLYPHLYFAMAVACARFAAIFLVSGGCIEYDYNSFTILPFSTRIL